MPWVRVLALAAVVASLAGCGSADEAELEHLGCANGFENAGSECVGGPSLSCPDGYELVEDICIEIDECRAKVPPCHELATCIDAIGEAICYCDPDRGLFGDGQTCVERSVQYQCACRETCDDTVVRDDHENFCEPPNMGRTLKDKVGTCPRTRPAQCMDWACDCSCVQTAQDCA